MLNEDNKTINGDALNLRRNFRDAQSQDFPREMTMRQIPEIYVEL